MREHSNRASFVSKKATRGEDEYKKAADVGMLQEDQT